MLHAHCTLMSGEILLCCEYQHGFTWTST